MAAPVIASKSSIIGALNFTSRTVTAPSGIVDGDLLLLVIALDGNPTAFVPPTGFTEISPNDGFKAPSDQATLYVAFKIASSESGSYTTSWTTGQHNITNMYRITGAVSGSEIQADGAVNTGTSTTPIALSFDTDTDDSLALAFHAVDRRNASFNGGTGWTVEDVDGTGGGSASVASVIARKTIGTKGATLDTLALVALAQSEEWVSIQIAIRSIGVPATHTVTHTTDSFLVGTKITHDTDSILKALDILLTQTTNSITKRLGSDNNGCWIDPTVLEAYIKTNNDVIDATGNTNDGTWTGTEQYATGKVPPTTNGAADFDGSSRVTLANESNFDFIDRLNKSSIGLWMKCSTLLEQMLVSKRGVSADDAWDFKVRSSGILRLTFRHLNADKISVDGSTNICDGLWHHVMFTYDGSGNASGVKLYVDGVRETEVIQNDTLTASFVNNIAVNIGAKDNNTTFFTGQIDDVQFYKRELSPQEAKFLFQNNSPVEVDSNFRADRCHDTDSFLLAIQTPIHTTNSVLKAIGTTVSHTTDSQLNTVVIITHTTDSLVVSNVEPFHDTDSVLKAIGTTLIHTTDSVVYVTQTLDHDTDSVLKATDTLVIHDTDSVLKGIGTGLETHTTDSVLKLLDNEITHDTDSILKAITTLIHTTDSHLVQVVITILIHHTDSVLKSLDNLVTHTTDSLIVVNPGIIGGSVEANLCVKEEIAQDLCVDETTTEDQCVKEESEVDLCA